MNIPMMLINLFCIPMIAMMVYYKRNQKEYLVNGEFLFHYGVYTALIPTISKMIVIVIRKMFSLEFDVDSSYYALIASVIAFLLPYMMEIIKKNCEITIKIDMQDSDYIKKQEENT